MRVDGRNFVLITVLIFAAMLAPRAYGEEIPDLIIRNAHIIGTGSQLDPGLIDEIRVATNSNYAAGSRKLQAQAAVMLGQRDAGKIRSAEKEQRAEIEFEPWAVNCT